MKCLSRRRLGYQSDFDIPLDRVILGLEENMTKNIHNVQAKAWQKWNEQQRALFNGTYEDIQNVGCEMFVHPTTIQRKLTKDEFDTIAWNAAWTAAHVLVKQLTGEVITLLSEDDQRIIASVQVADKFADQRS